MKKLIVMAVAGWLLLRLPAEVPAQGYLAFEPQSGVSDTWLFGLVGVGVVVVLALIYNAISRQRQKAPVKAVQQHRKVDFQKHAAKLGFKIAEIKTLRLIANKIAPQDPDSLLTTDSGRERLAADLRDRVRRREREMTFLRGIQEKLKLMREHGLQERATIRIETDLSIWIVKRAGGASTEEEEGEEVFADAEQVGGRLLNLSEGGAAVIADLEVEVNDMVELWSADPDIWIPPVTGGVLQVEKSAKGPVFHLHFIDPPLSELRAALQTLQRNAGLRAP